MTEIKRDKSKISYLSDPRRVLRVLAESSPSPPSPRRILAESSESSPNLAESSESAPSPRRILAESSESSPNLAESSESAPSPRRILAESSESSPNRRQGSWLAQYVYRPHQRLAGLEPGALGLVVGLYRAAARRCTAARGLAREAATATATAKWRQMGVRSVHEVACWGSTRTTCTSAGVASSGGLLAVVRWARVIRGHLPGIGRPNADILLVHHGPPPAAMRTAERLLAGPTRGRRGAPRRRARGTRGGRPVSGARQAGGRVPAEPTMLRLNRRRSSDFRIAVIWIVSNTLVCCSLLPKIRWLGFTPYTTRDATQFRDADPMLTPLHTHPDNKQMSFS